VLNVRNLAVKNLSNERLRAKNPMLLLRTTKTGRLSEVKSNGREEKAEWD
jgi:hypothetical protein